MDSITLKAAKRDETAARELRRNGKVPCVVYGKVDNMTLVCEERDLVKAHHQAGESTVVQLDVDGKKTPVLFHVIDLDPVSDRPIHVDFYAVDMKKEVEAEVQLRFTGEAPAVKEFGAVLLHPEDMVTVRALPANLPHDLEVDLSGLMEVDAALHVSDIKTPEGVEILSDPETVIALVQAAREEEPEEPAAPEAVEGEGAEGAKAEGEGAAESGEKTDGEKKE